jgi:hypothetical protein
VKWLKDILIVKSIISANNMELLEKEAVNMITRNEGGEGHWTSLA